jgi:hypothetical protein
MNALRACEQLADRNNRRPSSFKVLGGTYGEIRAGRALAAEAWCRGLISAGDESDE